MTHEETLWEFTLGRIRVAWSVSPDYGYRYDGDDEDGEVQSKLDSGEYVAFDSAMRVYIDGHELGCDYLGGNVYDDPRKFRDHIGSQGKWGSYFTGMVHASIAEARTELARLRA